MSFLLHVYLDWQVEEQADILYLYKTIQMDANYKNNYKELARRMKDAGWTRDNDQCRHQVNRCLHIAFKCSHCHIVSMQKGTLLIVDRSTVSRSAMIS